MNITVYCGASAGSEPIYEQKASELGQWLAAHGITLVYGGGRTGLMGKLANAVLANGGKAVGVIPEFLKTAEEVHTGLTRLITVDTMSQRKDTMLQMGDAFIALPGGAGTLEEIAEAISAARLGRQALHAVQHPRLLRPFGKIIRPHGKGRLSQSSRPRKGKFRHVY